MISFGRRNKSLLPLGLVLLVPFLVGAGRATDRTTPRQAEPLPAVRQPAPVVIPGAAASPAASNELGLRLALRASAERPRRSRR